MKIVKKTLEKTAYWIGILTIGIVVGVTVKAVSAWVEPNAMPPGGNIAAPLNTGNIGQSKQGGLTLNIGGATYGLIVDKGLVGIGVTAPGEKLEVNGNIKLSGSSPSFKVTNVATPTNPSDVATKGYVDSLGTGTGSGCSMGWVNISAEAKQGPNYVYWQDAKDHSPTKMCQDAGYTFATGSCKTSLPNAALIEGSIVANTYSYNPNWAVSCNFGQDSFYMNIDPSKSQLLCAKCP